MSNLLLSETVRREWGLFRVDDSSQIFVRSSSQERENDFGRTRGDGSVQWSVSIRSGFVWIESQPMQTIIHRLSVSIGSRETMKHGRTFPFDRDVRFSRFVRAHKRQVAEGVLSPQSVDQQIRDHESTLKKSRVEGVENRRNQLPCGRDDVFVS